MSRLSSLSAIASRALLGAIFFVFGLNGFLDFIPIPPHEGEAATFMGGLAASGYFFPLLKGTEVVAGAMLLANRFVPLALVLLAPIVLNIVAFHVMLAPGGWAMQIVMVGTGVYLAWYHRAAFGPMLRAKPSKPQER